MLVNSDMDNYFTYQPYDTVTYYYMITILFFIILQKTTLVKRVKLLTSVVK